MRKDTRTSIAVQGTDVGVLMRTTGDYICLTDIAKRKDKYRSEHIIQNWMRNRNTIEFLGVWERLYNPDFKHLEFEVFRTKAGIVGTSYLIQGCTIRDNLGSSLLPNSQIAINHSRGRIVIYYVHGR